MKRKKYAVFTMDVEAFYNTDCISASGLNVDVDLLDGLDEYISILDRHDIKCTLFTVGDLAHRVADRLKSYIAKGHTLALHSYSHVAPINVQADQFRDRTRAALANMRELFHTEISGFRAPCFSMDKERLEILKELGFRYDSSNLGFRQARHTVKLDLDDFQQVRKNIFYKDGFYEFGLSKERVFGGLFPISGGGYVRLGNWGFIKTLIWNHIRQNDYYVFYLHPFELTKQKIPVMRELKSYDQYYLHKGIRTYGRRIEKIISMLQKQDYEFVTFEELVQIMNRERAAQNKA